MYTKVYGMLYTVEWYMQSLLSVIIIIQTLNIMQRVCTHAYIAGRLHCCVDF